MGNRNKLENLDNHLNVVQHASYNTSVRPEFCIEKGVGQ